MSTFATLARPYAKAAFEVAREHDRLAEWGALLASAAVVVQDETVAGWLKSPDMQPQQVIGIIEDTTGGAMDEGFRRFLGALAENDRLALLPEVAELYGRLRAEAEQRLEVRVVSAVALDEEQAERMKSALAKRFDREIELRNEVQPDVLGGAIIYAGDEVIDGSLRGRLERLRGALS